MNENTSLQIRRVVTGHDADGKALIVQDKLADNVIVMPSGHAGALMWAADADLARVNGTIDGGADPGKRKLPGIAPPEGGHVFRILQLAPGKSAFMHRTDTIDYCIVMKGECVMKLDGDEEVAMAAGDVLVQRGTWHGWENRGDEPCQLAFILIRAEAPDKHLHGGEETH
jgi:quercetin dioxygenase-like cupin family protein